ncbi:MAG: DUF3489 domain-containing protein [Candidatus Thiodiazotropha taylori]|nr:DUF3489 domain-containing protein [Candidatus Thiodiazotropha taylori]
MNNPASAPASNRKSYAHKTRVAQRKSKIKTKKQIGLSLLRRRHGCSLKQLQNALAWQPHSVRGFLSTMAKQLTHYDLVSEKPEGKPRCYRLVAIEQVAS